MSSHLFDAADVEALGKMVTPLDAIPTPPPAETPPAEKPAAETPPAKEPEPAPPTVEDSVTLSALAEMQAETQQALKELAEFSKSIVDQARSEGDRRPEQTILDEFEDESPALQSLAKVVHESQAKLDKVLERLEAEDQAKAEKAKIDEKIAQYESEHTELRQTFPALNQKEMDQVWDWMEKHPAEASRMSLRSVAEKVHGYDFLDARRKPSGLPPGTPPPPPEVPTAKVVTETAIGSGAAPSAFPPSESTGGDVRDAFNGIRSNPADLAKLGSYGR